VWFARGLVKESRINHTRGKCLEENTETDTKAVDGQGLRLPHNAL